MGILLRVYKNPHRLYLQRVGIWLGVVFGVFLFHFANSAAGSAEADKVYNCIGAVNAENKETEGDSKND